MGKLIGKTAVITGGSSGIGLASAKRFVAEGATVFIMGRRQSLLDLAVAEIDGDIHAVQGDVAKLADLDRLYDAVASAGRRIDILFANAGMAISASLGEIKAEDFDAMMGVNVRGPLFTVQKALPIFNDQGSIILRGAKANLRGSDGRSVYVASKAAVRSFARVWARDLKDRRIRVNLISPGPPETFELANASRPARNALVALSLSERPSQLEKITDSVLFLASGESAFVNASEFFADGGYARA